MDDGYGPVPEAHMEGTRKRSDMRTHTHILKVQQETSVSAAVNMTGQGFVGCDY